MSPADPHPRLSVIVTIVSDTTVRAGVAHLTRSLEALEPQAADGGVEIIVAYAAPLAGIDSLARRFPRVRFLPVEDLEHRPGGGSREHHDELRARGLAAASGELVALLEDHALPAADWCRQVLEAHREQYAGIGGAIENNVDRMVNWAVYFCDFGRYQNPVPNAETDRVSDANVSYKRASLDAVKTVWSRSFHEPAVNGALMARGEKLLLSPRIVVHQNREGIGLADALRERFIWGRSYARARSRSAGAARALVYAGLSPLLPGLLLLRMGRQVMEKRRHRARFLMALPVTAALLTAWAAGEGAGYLSGDRRP
jgi:hypothetical protein